MSKHRRIRNMSEHADASAVARERQRSLSEGDISPDELEVIRAEGEGMVPTSPPTPERPPHLPIVRYARARIDAVARSLRHVRLPALKRAVWLQMESRPFVILGLAFVVGSVGTILLQHDARTARR